MGCTNPSGRTPSGNPHNITELEATSIEVVADLPLDAIRIEVFDDQAAAGFRTWIGRDRAAHVSLLFAIAAADLLRAKP